MTDDLELYDPDGDAADELARNPEPVFDAERANRLLFALRRRRERITEAHALAEAEARRIDRWLAEQVNALAGACDFIEDSLAQYHRLVLDRDPKSKTIKLPNGTLKSRATQDKIEWTDEAVDWITQAGDESVLTTVTTTKLDKKAAAQRYKVTDDGRVVDAETGEPVPDDVATGVPADRSFSVVLSDD